MAPTVLREPDESDERPLSPPSRSSLLYIGMDRSGHWVVRDPAGLCGGLFMDRTQALRFALRERHPQAVIMVPGALEFAVGAPVPCAANEARGASVCENSARGRVGGRPKAQGAVGG